ncbi:hypothetical protein CHS0354_012831 [Potamilus streckersoni]|uniref:Otopetrin n=1 Tax=Potamilus streckersoni TaxID=2493646 RepID=A0AAE0SWI9_9BIVA|nr:hypothetical protein CHS0354_012831 [Potamilus streckersoni]
MRSGVYIVNEPRAESNNASEPDHVFLNNMEGEANKVVQTPEDQGQLVQPDQVPPNTPNGNTETSVEQKEELEEIKVKDGQTEMPLDVPPMAQEESVNISLEPQGESTPQKINSKRKRTLTLPPLYRSSLVRLICGLYALLIIVLSTVFATATSLTAKERQHLYYLEIFLVYLYLTSLLILVYFQVVILRGVKVKASYFETNIRVTVRPDGSIAKSPTASPHPNRHFALPEEEQPLDNGKEEQISISSRHSQLVLPADGSVAHVGEGINFYLRLGALAFAFGSVTLDGFHIASYFETLGMESCKSSIFILVYVMHLLFTFFQTFFLFKNHKLVIDKQKARVRFGMMHLMATNIAVLLVTIITETAEDYRLKNYQENKLVNVSKDAVKSCYDDLTLARTSSPYLFPCTIIYSIIAAGIIYRLYQYIGMKIKQRWPSHTSLTSSVPQGATSIDCEKANKGLFLGLLVAVVTLIAMATFFVFENRISDTNTAIKVFFVTEIALMVVTALGIVWGYVRLARLKFLENYFFTVDSVLLIVALAGTYIYLCFILISVASEIGSHGVTGILSIITIILALIQATMHTIFVLDGLCRCAENDEQMGQKPGRAVVTFLLVCNLALWVVSMFEVKKTQVVQIHIDFYGILAWNIINHLCVPLLIFFRFHSAICLSKIWFNAYQKEKQI